MEFPGLYRRALLVICFTDGSVYMSIPNPQFTPLPSFPRQSPKVCIPLLCSLFLLCTEVRLYHSYVGGFTFNLCLERCLFLGLTVFRVEWVPHSPALLHPLGALGPLFRAWKLTSELLCCLSLRTRWPQGPIREQGPCPLVPRHLSLAVVQTSPGLGNFRRCLRI